jgi:hypothetical protein
MPHPARTDLSAANFVLSHPGGLLPGDGLPLVSIVSRWSSVSAGLRRTFASWIVPRRCVDVGVCSDSWG